MDREGYGNETIYYDFAVKKFPPFGRGKVMFYISIGLT